MDRQITEHKLFCAKPDGKQQPSGWVYRIEYSDGEWCEEAVGPPFGQEVIDADQALSLLVDKYDIEPCKVDVQK